MFSFAQTIFQALYKRTVIKVQFAIVIQSYGESLQCSIDFGDILTLIQTPPYVS